jgi:hypothetical protein
MLSTIKIYFIVLKQNKIIIFFLFSLLLLILNPLINVLSSLFAIILPVIYLDPISTPQETFYEIPVFNENVRTAILYFHKKNLLLISDRDILNLNEDGLRGLLMCEALKSGLTGLWLDRAISNIDTYLEQITLGEIVEKYCRHDFIFNIKHTYFRDDPLFFSSLEIAQRAGKLENLMNTYQQYRQCYGTDISVEIGYAKLFQAKAIGNVSSF